jgi:hypothetical protein
MGTVAGGAALGAGAAYGAKKMYDKSKEKKAAALDVYAAQLAFEKIAESQQWDVDEAVDRLNAVLTLGVEEEKTAGVYDPDMYLEARALELAEAAGYPVEWPEYEG